MAVLRVWILLLLLLLLVVVLVLLLPMMLSLLCVRFHLLLLLVPRPHRHLRSFRLPHSFLHHFSSTARATPAILGDKGTWC